MDKEELLQLRISLSKKFKMTQTPPPPKKNVPVPDNQVPIQCIRQQGEKMRSMITVTRVLLVSFLDNWSYYTHRWFTRSLPRTTSCLKSMMLCHCAWRLRRASRLSRFSSWSCAHCSRTLSLTAARLTACTSNSNTFLRRTRHDGGFIYWADLGGGA